MTSNELAGFPHSEISGSLVVCTSPELIAAYHVLHRLHAPRHPPCALSSLTIEFAQYKLDQHIDSLTPRSSRDLAISEEIFLLGILPIRLSKSTSTTFVAQAPATRKTRTIPFGALTCQVRLQEPFQDEQLETLSKAFQIHGGGEGTRTPDPMVANHVLCQLSYTPNPIVDFGLPILD